MNDNIFSNLLYKDLTIDDVYHRFIKRLDDSYESKHIKILYLTKVKSISDIFKYGFNSFIVIGVVIIINDDIRIEILSNEQQPIIVTLTSIISILKLKHKNSCLRALIRHGIFNSVIFKNRFIDLFLGKSANRVRPLETNYVTTTVRVNKDYKHITDSLIEIIDNDCNYEVVFKNKTFRDILNYGVESDIINGIKFKIGDKVSVIIKSCFNYIIY